MKATDPSLDVRADSLFESLFVIKPTTFATTFHFGAKMKEI